MRGGNKKERKKKIIETVYKASKQKQKFDLQLKKQSPKRSSTQVKHKNHPVFRKFKNQN